MHPWTRVGRWGTVGTRPDAISSLCRLRRLTYECRLEGDKTHDIFHFLKQKSGGGHFLCGPHQAEKSPPIYAHGLSQKWHR